MQRVGTCSNCGGDVVGYRGSWMATVPPPPDRCSSCGGVARSDVIEIVPRPYFEPFKNGTAITQQYKRDNWTSTVLFSILVLIVLGSLIAVRN